MSTNLRTPKLQLFQQEKNEAISTPQTNNNSPTLQDLSPASTFGNSIANSSFPTTPSDRPINYHEDPTKKLIHSLRNSQIKEPCFSQFKFENESKSENLSLWSPEEFGNNHQQHLFAHNPNSESDDIDIPKTHLPEKSNRYTKIIESPTWRRGKDHGISKSSSMEDPFCIKKLSQDFTDSSGIKHHSNTINTSEIRCFQPREDRQGLQLSADTAQAMLPPNACVFVANLSHCRTDEQLEYSVTAIFNIFGDVYVKVRRDSKGMPFAFCQYKNSDDAQRAILLGRGTLIDGRPCRTEVAKVNRSLYLSKITGEIISETEAHKVLNSFGALEKVWYCSETEKEMFRLPEGIWVMFAFFQDCRDAQSGFRANTQYRLEQPKFPRDLFNQTTKTLSSILSPPIIGSKTKDPLSVEARISSNFKELFSIFVGNLPNRCHEIEIKKLFQLYGKIEKVELIKKPAIYHIENSAICFAFIEFSHLEDACEAIQSIFMFAGRRLRIQKKANSLPHYIGFPNQTKFDNADLSSFYKKSLAQIFHQGISVGIANSQTQSKIYQDRSSNLQWPTTDQNLIEHNILKNSQNLGTILCHPMVKQSQIRHGFSQSFARSQNDLGHNWTSEHSRRSFTTILTKNNTELKSVNAYEALNFQNGLEYQWPVIHTDQLHVEVKKGNFNG